jgi:hypothetical protein
MDSESLENRKQLEQGIRSHLLTTDTYHFRPIKIDGINVYIVLYGKYKILNIESIYINCNVRVNGRIEKQKYSLYHYKYKTLSAALNRVEKIRNGYRIYNGEIVSANCYKMLKLEETVLPYSDDEKCSVCYENTSDSTCCGHSICLNCREICLFRNQKDCPMCRKPNALEIYTNKNGLVNNEQYEIVKRAIHSEKINEFVDGFIPFVQPLDINYEVEDSDDEEEDDDDDDDDEESEEPAHQNNEGIIEGLNEGISNGGRGGEDMPVNELSNIINDTDDSADTLDTIHGEEIPQVFWRISRSPSNMEDDINNLNVSLYIGFSTLQNETNGEPNN